MKAVNSDGFASPELVAAAAGDYFAFVDYCPAQPSFNAYERRGSIVVSSPWLGEPGVISALLYEGLKYIWLHCDQWPLMTVGSIDIYYRERSDQARIVHAERLHEFSDRWESVSVVDPMPLTPMHQAQIDAVAAAAARARQEREAAARAAEAEQQLQDAIYASIGRARQLESYREFQRQLKREAQRKAREQYYKNLLIASGIVVIAALLLYLMRYAIARTYYYYFSPHPAANTIRAALVHDARINGPALVEMLSEAPSGSGALREARFLQGRQLFRELEAAIQRRKSDIEAANDAVVRETRQQTALVRMQEALGRATEAFERANALFKGSKSGGSDI